MTPWKGKRGPKPICPIKSLHERKLWKETFRVPFMFCTFVIWAISAGYQAYESIKICLIT